jgi:hypothetical protein
MDGRDLFVYIVMLCMTPLFLAILVVAFALIAPVYVPLELWQWSKRRRQARRVVA